MTVDTKKLRELAEAATPGPWQDNPAAYECKVCSGEWNDIDWPRQWAVAHTMYAHDTAFIAAANPQTVIALLDALDEANRRSEVSYSTGIGYARDERDRLREEKWALEQQLAAMTAARDEACDLALDAIDGTSEHGLRIRELRKVGQ